MAGMIQKVQRPSLDHRAQQDARGAALQRVPHVLPAERGRVLRLLLRLLPARGLRPVAGPLHREGLRDQPGDRPAAPRRDGGAVRPPRRDHRRVGVVHLRPGLAGDLQRERPDPRQARRHDRPRRAAAQARLACSTSATTRRSAAGRSACAATRWRSSRPTRSTAFRALVLRRRGGAPAALRPADGRADRRRPRARRDLARHALQRQGGDDRVRGRGDRPGAQRALRRAGGGRASCSSPTACASARSTTWRCCARSGSARASRTTRASSTAAPPASRPYCLIDYFPEDFVCFIDESHQTTPQIGGMYEGDRSRKQTLVDYGFRLPSAMDNRPQTFDEFLSITPQICFVSATPGPYERDHSSRDRRADRASDGDRRPRGRGARDAQPDRRPDERDPGRAWTATSARW